MEHAGGNVLEELKVRTHHLANLTRSEAQILSQFIGAVALVVKASFKRDVGKRRLRIPDLPYCVCYAPTPSVPPDAASEALAKSIDQIRGMQFCHPA